MTLSLSSNFSSHPGKESSVTTVWVWNQESCVICHAIDGGSVLGNDDNLASFICLMLQLLLLMSLKATPLLTKENETRVELHRHFFSIVHKATHYAGVADICT